jgi:hypothetical protein
MVMMQPMQIFASGTGIEVAFTVLDTESMPTYVHTKGLHQREDVGIQYYYTIKLLAMRDCVRTSGLPHLLYSYVPAAAIDRSWQRKKPATEQPLPEHPLPEQPLPEQPLPEQPLQEQPPARAAPTRAAPCQRSPCQTSPY